MTDKHSYVSFLTDEQIYDAINSVFSGYMKKNKTINFKTFNKRIVDPLHMLFLTKFAGIGEEDWVKHEIMRQADRTLSNLIGSFQEEILGYAPGFKRYKVGDSDAHSMDIINDDHTIIADIKNKYNTVKGSSKPGLFKELDDALKIFPNATAYYVRILDNKSQNEVWSFTSKEKKYRNPKIRKVSGDKFYEIAFGKNDALAELTSALPKAIDDFLSQKGKYVNKENSLQLLNEIRNVKEQNNYQSLYEVIRQSALNKKSK